MAHKDYVSRGRASKTPPPEEKTSLPWPRLLFTLILVGAFVFGLWSIKDRSETHPVATTPTEQVEEEPLPDMPEEEWEFITTLPQYQVEVEEREEQVSEKTYIMQCGSFRREDQAEQMEARIAFLGLDADVHPSQGKNGLWYRVILGPYTSKRDAEKDRHEMRRNDITTCRIW